MKQIIDSKDTGVTYSIECERPQLCEKVPPALPFRFTKLSGCGQKWLIVRLYNLDNLQFQVLADELKKAGLSETCIMCLKERKYNSRSR